MMVDLKSLLKSLEFDAPYFALREVHSRSLHMYVRNEVFEGMSENEDHGLMAEVMIGGHLAYAATNSFQASDVLACLNRAKRLAESSHRHALHPFSLKERPVVEGEYRSPYQKGFDQLNTKDIHDLLFEISKEMKIHENIIDRNVGFSIKEMFTRIVSNTGSDIIQEILRTNIGMSATAQNENESQHRTYGHDLNHQFGLEIIERSHLLSNAKRIAEEAMELLSSENCPTEVCDLVLNPEQMYLQIHESIGHPLELDRILGDERNYAGWSFVKPHDFGKLQYGSKLMNVTFDPTVVGQNASYFADDIGAIAKREFLIKDGLLLKGLGSLESQNRLGLGGVSSQRATNWNRAPIDRMANVNLEPGQSSLNEIIKSVEKGVFMYSNRSWSIDDYRNKFQFGCEYGKLIENGQITKTVKNPNYRGITNQFWNSLKMVGDRSTYEIGGLSNCGKGEPNQVIFVGHASPVCLFSNIEVFGGGK